MLPVEIRLEQAIITAMRLYNRLAFLCGSSESARGQLLKRFSAAKGISCLNLGLDLSKTLLDVPVGQRPLKLSSSFAALLPKGEVVIVNHIEILFEPSLETDPCKLLQHYSRNRVLLVSWPGQLRQGNLLYGSPDHPEYKTYLASGIVLVDLVGEELPAANQTMNRHKGEEWSSEVQGNRPV